jgi:CTP synthase (UTP-ammonia lyase)
VADWPEIPGKMKYVPATVGVASGLGKGVSVSSVAVILKACGLRFRSTKIGTCSPPACDVV